MKNFILRIIAPDYFKLKGENKSLKKDIYNLVERKDFHEGITTMAHWKMFYLAEKKATSGDGTEVEPFGIVADAMSSFGATKSESEKAIKTLSKKTFFKNKLL